jgi:hypothetical protein
MARSEEPVGKILMVPGGRPVKAPIAAKNQDRVKINLTVVRN